MLSVKLRQISWGVLGIEALAIFLSVLLGFAASEWRSDWKDAALRTQALENFRAELADNQREVEARLPYHQSVLDGTRALLQSGEAPRSFEDLAERSGFRGPNYVFLQQTALRTADATGALALLDYPTAKAVTATYELQRLLLNTQESVMAAGMNPAIFSEENVEGTMTVLNTYFQIVTEYENALMQAYPDVLAHLDEQLGTATAPSVAPGDTTTVDSLR